MIRRVFNGIVDRYRTLLVVLLATVAAAVVALVTPVYSGFGWDFRAAIVLLSSLAASLAVLVWRFDDERRARKRQELNLLRANLRLRRMASQQERLARVDALTGLPNRRAWDEGLAAEWRRAQRYGTHPAVILLDLDGFKGVNDRYGHDAGDRALQAAADALRQALRDSDIVGRLGGDEFGILLPEAGDTEARLVAEKAQRMVSDALRSAWPDDDGLGASAGFAALAAVAAMPPDGMAALLRAADQALYDAKAAGRHRVSAAPAEDDRGARQVA